MELANGILHIVHVQHGKPLQSMWVWLTEVG
jgi:hypothetical protein